MSWGVEVDVFCGIGVQFHVTGVLRRCHLCDEAPVPTANPYSGRRTLSAKLQTGVSRSNSVFAVAHRYPHE